MPALVLCRRRWSLGGDDLVFPGMILFSFRAVCIVALVVFIHILKRQQQLSSLCLSYFSGAITLHAISMIAVAGLIYASAQGTILDSKPRSAAKLHWFIYALVLFLFLDIIWTVVGTHRTFTSSECGVPTVVLSHAIKAFIIAMWLFIAGHVVFFYMIYDPRGSLGNGHFDAVRRWRADNRSDYVASWEHRCSWLCCFTCLRGDDDKDIYSDVSIMLASYFSNIDFVPSDVAACLALVRAEQKRDNSGIYISGNSASSNTHKALPRTARSFSVDPSNDVDHLDVLEAAHFSSYALGAYGWPLWAYMNIFTGFCKLGPCGCCTNPNSSHGDNYCNWNRKAAELQGAANIVYSNFHNAVYRTPFIVCLDHDRHAVVVAIRGTLSLKDCLTDASAADVDCSEYVSGAAARTYIAHKGMMAAARNIAEDLEEQGILRCLFSEDDMYKNYSLVITGHSLGAGTASCLAWILRPKYPDLFCYAFSPPGAVFNHAAAKRSCDFIISVVIGKDMIPRLGLRQLDDLRDALIKHASRSMAPKCRVLGSCICCRVNAEKLLLDEEEEPSSETLQVISDYMNSFTPPSSDSAYINSCRMYPSGRILHIVKISSKRHFFFFKQRSYHAAWADLEDFQEILVSPRMIFDHFPDVVHEVLTSVAKNLSDKNINYQLLRQSEIDIYHLSSMDSSFSLLSSWSKISHDDNYSDVDDDDDDDDDDDAAAAFSGSGDNDTSSSNDEDNPSRISQGIKRKNMHGSKQHQLQKKKQQHQNSLQKTGRYSEAYLSKASSKLQLALTPLPLFQKNVLSVSLTGVPWWPNVMTSDGIFSSPNYDFMAEEKNREPFYTHNVDTENNDYGDRIVRVLFDTSSASNQVRFDGSSEQPQIQSPLIGQLNLGVGVLHFESRFESGNLMRVVQIREREYNMWLRTDLFTLRHTQWFYFQIKGAKKGTVYKFNILNMMKKDSLYNHGIRPLFYSVHDGVWVRRGESVRYYKNQFRQRNSPINRHYYSLSWTWKAERDSDTVYFAHCYPYTYTMLQQYVDRLCIDPIISKFCRRRTLCKTLAGNRVDLLTITAPTSVPAVLKARRGIMVTARVHPGEVNGSWMMKGLIDFLTSCNPDAVLFRQNFVIKVVPMLNPDGVIVGNYRCSLAGVDLNRCWKNPLPTVHPTIYATKQMMKKFLEDRHVVAFLDMHGHSRKKNIFIYGCDTNSSNSRLRACVIPRMLSLNAPQYFSYESCKFRVEASKSSTGRVVSWSELGIKNSYTIEASFGGSSLPGPLNGMHFGIKDFEHIGVAFVDTILDYCDPNESKYMVIMNQLESELRNKVLRAQNLPVNEASRSMINLNVVDMNTIESDTSGSDSSPSEADEPAMRIRVNPSSDCFVMPKYKKRVDRYANLSSGGIPLFSKLRMEERSRKKASKESENIVGEPTVEEPAIIQMLDPFADFDVSMEGDKDNFRESDPIVE